MAYILVFDFRLCVEQWDLQVRE